MTETGHRGPDRAWHYGQVDHCGSQGCLQAYRNLLAIEPPLLWVPAHLRMRISPGHPQERPDWDRPNPDMCGAWRPKWNQQVPDSTPRCELPPGHVSPVGRSLGVDHIGRHPSGRWCTWRPFPVSGGNGAAAGGWVSTRRRTAQPGGTLEL